MVLLRLIILFFKLFIKKQYVYYRKVFIYYSFVRNLEISKELLTPSLVIYKPTKSAMASLRVRFSGVFALIIFIFLFFFQDFFFLEFFLFSISKFTLLIFYYFLVFLFSHIRSSLNHIGSGKKIIPEIIERIKLVISFWNKYFYFRVLVMSIFSFFRFFY